MIVRGQTLVRRLVPTPALVLIAYGALASSVAAQQPGPTAQPPAGQGAAPTSSDDQVVLPARLIDRPPFDRITLNAANNNAVVDVVLLDLPDRRLPDPLPTTGSLAVRQLSQPGIPYTVEWSAIAKMDLYEQMLLAEATRLAAAGTFAEAFEYFAYLQTNYPQLAGLPQAEQNYLWRDAAATFAAGDGENAWPALVALYERNPNYARLAIAVQAVSDALIKQHLDAKNYSAARAVLSLLEKQFPKLTLANIDGWRQRFAGDARTQLDAARSALARREFDAARAAAMFADGIEPGSREARELLQQIQAAAPEMRVGVTQAGGFARTNAAPDWADAARRASA